jgi:hypothetical protein
MSILLSNVPFKDWLPPTGTTNAHRYLGNGQLLLQKLDVSQKSSNCGPHITFMEGEGGCDFINRPGVLDVIRCGADCRHGFSLSPEHEPVDNICMNC